MLLLGRLPFGVREGWYSEEAQKKARLAFSRIFPFIMYLAVDGN
jgi:hypothetical protein